MAPPASDRPTAAAPQPTLLSDSTIELAGSGVDVHVATADASLRPEYALGMGIRVHPDRRNLTVYVARAVLHRTLDNIRETGRIAITLARPYDHKTLQLKGRVTAVRDSGPADRELQEQYRAAFTEQLAIVGVPRAMSRRLAWWPSVAIDVEIADVFAQTPGPGAGARIAG